MYIKPILNFKGSEYDNRKRLKRRILVTSAIGTAAAFGIICHRQGFKLKNITKTSPKNWALFKIKGKTLELKEKQILALATGSVIGGLVGGAMFDEKYNFKAKLKEALNQMLGNVAIPVAFVGGTSRFYEKHKAKILSKVPQIKKKGGFFKFVNKALMAVPAVALTGIALAVGIITGNRVSNFINEKLYGQKVDRNIKATDFAPHVDDLCLAVTLMAPGTAVGEVIARTIPAFLTVPGYQTGMAHN